VLCCFNESVDHGGRRGDTALRPASYRRIRMAIEIASNLPAFFIFADSLLPTNTAK
jgi:hypothetical protein